MTGVAGPGVARPGVAVALDLLGAGSFEEGVSCSWADAGVPVHAEKRTKVPIPNVRGKKLLSWFMYIV
ncbi:MAG: hypothetical protein FD137_497 [Spirochaetes bacterium]|nr:MAG: hypothetical protein FD137_497 [Spirochaetota bacterium]